MSAGPKIVNVLEDFNYKTRLRRANDRREARVFLAGMALIFGAATGLMWLLGVVQ